MSNFRFPYTVLCYGIVLVISTNALEVVVLDLRTRASSAPRQNYKFFYFPDDLTRFSRFKYPPTSFGVHLPRVEVLDYDFGHDLIPYDPSHIDFPPPPKIPESDGYKTQFVCDYDYDPSKDHGSLYHDYCFHYIYTPKEKEESNAIVSYPPFQYGGQNLGGLWWWRLDETTGNIFIMLDDNLRPY